MARNSIPESVLDIETPCYEYLSARFKRSFAYHTVLNRLPVTVTQVIDHLSREKEEIVKVHGEESREEIKNVIGYLSKLKNELQTNKSMTPLIASSEIDMTLWNKFLKFIEKDAGRPMSWFDGIWLHVECYFYRRIREGFALTHRLNAYDPFRNLKENAFTGSLKAISVVGDHLVRLSAMNPLPNAETTILQFLKLSLWGNRCDLSISGGADVAQVDNPLEKLSELDELIVVNQLDYVASYLAGNRSEKNIDIVFDNAGYELFTDICLAHILTKFCGVRCIRFHAKSIPWFISDVMEHDLRWLLIQMSESKIPCLTKLASNWRCYVEKGYWTISAEPFWTLPHSYHDMKAIDLELYESFYSSKMVIFKGDLNYRKLVGDRNWPTTEKFGKAIRDFHPAPITTLRTVKADVVVGLEEGQAAKMQNKDKDWMITGKYAVVSCVTVMPDNTLPNLPELEESSSPEETPS